MSLDEFKEVVEFVQKYHRFGWINDENVIKVKGERFALHIKYVDSCYDSRDKSIWMVKFRGFGNNLRFATNHFTGVNPPPDYFKFETLFDWVMAYLKGEWSNNNILKACTVND